MKTEQPMPVKNGERPVVDIAVEFLRARSSVGIEHYGTHLQTGNGRDFGQDADEEIADHFLYWIGYRIEHARRVQGLLATIGKLGEENKELRERLERVEKWAA